MIFAAQSKDIHHSPFTIHHSLHHSPLSIPHSLMPFKTYLLLFILALIPPIFIAQYQPAPGYLDSDYYFAGGIQLVNGKGFTEPYLWNYLDGTTSLPHPSHTYWMPLASMISALGMWLTGQTTYASARLFFILIAALVPPITALLAYQFSQKRGLAITSGLLAIFSVYHAPFVGVTDNFGLFMLFGGLYFLITTYLLTAPLLLRNWFLLGLLAGLLTLSRTDGLLWLALTFLFALWRTKKELPLNNRQPPAANHQPPSLITNYLLRITPLILLGFLIIMGPWYARNLNTFGTLMAPGGSRALWLENYDQTFIYPPSDLNLENFLALGWKEIISDRIWALSLNLQSSFAAHGGIILFPFIIAGIIYNRKDQRVKLATAAWLILFFVMTFIFPFAGARGAFFHAGAALQPIWWTLAPLGLDQILLSLRKLIDRFEGRPLHWVLSRFFGNPQNRIVFQSALVMIAMILTIFVVNLRLFTLGWGEGESNYPAVEQFLLKNGIQPDDIVIVNNAPGYYLETNRSAISIPYGAEDAILAVAKQFDAIYLALEEQAVLPQLKDLKENPQANSNFIFLGEVNGTYIFKINP